MPCKAKNVILLHTDQQRYDSLGCARSSCARTPHLRPVGGGGDVLRPARNLQPHLHAVAASLLTGLYPPGHGLWNNGCR